MFIGEIFQLMHYYKLVTPGKVNSIKSPVNHVIKTLNEALFSHMDYIA